MARESLMIWGCYQGLLFGLYFSLMKILMGVPQ